MTKCSRKGALTVMTSVFACTSFACLCIAISTDYWLHATERVTPEQTTSGTKVPLKRTSSGLWRKCVEYVNWEDKIITIINGTCSYISYFQQEDKDKNEMGPTDAILLSLRKSTVFPLLSLLILLAGEIVCLMSHCDRKKKVLTFLSGILFVIAGLLTLIGLILYIGAITEEAGNKSKSSSSSPMDFPRFQYSYGSSFILTVLSFTSAELTGVLSVYLYISRHKHSYRKKIERLQSTPSSLQAADGAAAGVFHPHQHNNIDAPAHHPIISSSSSSSSRPNGRAVAVNNGSPALVGMATRSNASDAFYTFTPMMAVRSACDIRGSRETLESDGLMVREPSRYTLSLAGTLDARTPNHRYPSAATATAETYRRTTPV